MKTIGLLLDLMMSWSTYLETAASCGTTLELPSVEMAEAHDAKHSLSPLLGFFRLVY